MTKFAHSQYTLLTPIALDEVRLTDRFWRPRLRTNRLVTLPSQFEQLEQTERLNHFRRAAGDIERPFVGRVYDDSDVYKWLEAAYWASAADQDEALSDLIDRVIGLIEKAQAPDGYLNTYFVLEHETERWKNLKDWHELYCAGHLIQAAIAERRALGSDRLLKVARRLADHIVERFGSRPGQHQGTGGHPEIEMALVELFRETGESNYLAQAAYFLEARGKNLIGGQAYHQDRVPFVELDRLEGHAVRAVYLAAGAADIYAETGQPELLRSLERLWDRLTSRQMYISGGIGARPAREAFGEDFELPNRLSYAESCAAIGNLMWAWRMLHLKGQAKYADLVERILYNGALVGISLDGAEYFYRNPLADSGQTQRKPWYSTACCPPNLARFLATVPGLIYGRSPDGIWIHLYSANLLETTLADGRPIRWKVKTDYPWAGAVQIRLESNAEFSLFLRIPAWCGPGTTRLRVNGQPTTADVTPGTYVRLDRRWEIGDQVDLEMELPVERIVAHPTVANLRGKAALMRGPVLYCLEEADHRGETIESLYLPANAVIETRFEESLFGGAVTLHMTDVRHPAASVWEGQLYAEKGQVSARPTEAQSVELTAVPYFAWANREPGWMQVWIPEYPD